MYTVSSFFLLIFVSIPFCHNCFRFLKNILFQCYYYYYYLLYYIFCFYLKLRHHFGEFIFDIFQYSVSSINLFLIFSLFKFARSFCFFFYPLFIFAFRFFFLITHLIVNFLFYILRNIPDDSLLTMMKALMTISNEAMEIAYNNREPSLVSCVDNSGCFYYFHFFTVCCCQDS